MACESHQRSPRSVERVPRKARTPIHRRVSGPVSTSTRPVYRYAELDRVLNPRSIAIVGASAKAGSFGERVLGNLSEFAGEIFLVNAKYDRLGERRCYPSIASLPAVPDCVAVTVPHEAVEEIVL